MAEDLRKLKRENRELRKYLRSLVATNRAALRSLDRVMLGPSTPERGQQIGMIAQVIDFETDAADHFALGRSFAQIKRAKQPKAKEGASQCPSD